MSIADKIASLNTALDSIAQAKNGIAQAITDKGVDTPAGTSWGDMIDNIAAITGIVASGSFNLQEATPIDTSPIKLCDNLWFNDGHMYYIEVSRSGDVEWASKQGFSYQYYTHTSGSVINEYSLDNLDSLRLQICVYGSSAADKWLMIGTQITQEIFDTFWREDGVYLHSKGLYSTTASAGDWVWTIRRFK